MSSIEPPPPLYPPPPEIGQADWGAQLNACVDWLYEVVAAVSQLQLVATYPGLQTRVTLLEGAVETLKGQMSSLDARVAALEAAMTFPSLLYSYVNINAPPPDDGQMRTDTTFAGQATTHMWLHQNSEAGLDVSSLMTQIDTTFNVFVEDAADSGDRQWYHVTSAPIAMVNGAERFFEIGVAWYAGVPSAPNNNRDVIIVFTNQL